MSSVPGIEIFRPSTYRRVELSLPDERSAEARGDIATRLGGADQRAEHLGFVDVAQQKLFEDGRARRIGADGHDVTNGFIDDAAAIQ